MIVNSVYGYRTIIFMYQLNLLKLLNPFPGFYLLMKLIIIRTLHDCPSQMNEHLLMSNSKLTSDSELIWWH